MSAVPNMTKVLKPQKTLIIGLGGSGTKTVILLKKYLSNFFDLKSSDFFKFLFIDCVDPVEDIGKIAPELRDEEEIIKIGTEITPDLINNPYISQRLDKHFYEFHKTDNARTNTNDGAGTTRAYSLISLFNSAEEVQARISGAYNHLLGAEKIRLTKSAEENGYEIERQDNTTPNILIFSSITGGTGSGTFIDIAALTRDSCNVGGGHPNIFGFFYLPDVFIDAVNDPNFTKLTIDQKTYIQANAYAALKEIEYFITNNPFNCVYNERVKVSLTNTTQNHDKLYDKIYLFDRFVNDDELAAENAWEVFKAVAESALHFTGSSIATFYPQRAIDNKIDARYYTGALGAKVISGIEDNGTRRMIYGSIGIHTLEIPEKDIYETFKLKAIDNFFNTVEEKKISDEELLKIVMNNSLNNRDDLIGRLGILYHKKQQSRFSRKKIDEKALYKVLRKYVLSITGKPSANADSYENLDDVSALRNWEAEVSGNLFDENIKKAEKKIDEFVENFEYDFESDGEKRLKGFYGTDKSINWSLNQLVLNIIDDENNKLNILYVEKVLKIIKDEVKDIKKSLLDMKNEDNRHLRSISEDISELLNKIERGSNFLSFISDDIDLGALDDIKENMDIKSGKYKNDIDSVVSSVIKNQRILIERYLIDALLPLMDYIVEKIDEMLTVPNSLYGIMREVNKKLRKELSGAVEKNTRALIYGNNPIQPLMIRFVPTSDDFDELFNVGLANLNKRALLSALAEKNIKLSDIYKDNWSLNKLLEIFESQIKDEYDKIKDIISFDNEQFFDEHDIDQMQKQLKSRSLPLLKFKKNNLDPVEYFFMINPAESDEWKLEGINEMRGNSIYKYTFIQITDGIPSMVIYNINKWHDIYTDIMRARTFPDKKGGNVNVRPLHIFKTPIPYEPYVDENMILMLNKTPNFLQSFTESVFNEALQYKIIEGGEGAYIYRGVIDFGPAVKDEFINRMKNNFSFLWDLNEAIYDVKKYRSDQVGQSVADLNKQMLENAKMQAEIDGIKENIIGDASGLDKRLSNIVNKINGVDNEE